MLNLFTRVVSFLLFGASLLWYKPLYALILVVTALPMAVVEFQLVARWWDLTQGFVPHHKKRHVLEKPYSSPHSFVQALMFNQMPALRQQIDVNVNDVISSYDKIRALIVKREVFTYLFSVLVLCGVIIHAIRSTLTTGGEIGTLTIVMAAAKIFQKNLENIVSLIAEHWNSAKGIILIEKEFFGLKPLISTKHSVTLKFNGIPLIRFERVSFAYPQSDTLALKEVSFTLEPGSKVAIVGKSGNGKSTIQALLTRQYDPTSGSIFVEDIDLKRIEPSRWNQFIAALTQEWAILERPIGEEIASSRLGETIDLEEVAASARFANFVEVVDADPAGYNSQIGTEFGGREFSGGEKQRLALARVHYRGTPILILDEPDAKLDPESAKKVMERIFALKGVTVVIITHHVSRAEQCDKIIVMGKGEIAEQGTHAELMARNGVYASMYRKDQKRLG
jgi:ATP-binding cassette subfamily B protein